MDPLREIVLAETRRQFFGKMAAGIGGLALSSLMADDVFGQMPAGVPPLRQIAPKATRCIYLHMMGGPPQMD
ncbi:MAG TPA: sulfatase, partial [Gemmatimonadetes bacterium]|nr:sulfatase [Gemmatimonadota bacterium]